MNCGVCNNNMGVLGRLGHATHYQCRACGTMAFKQPGDLKTKPWPQPVLRSKEPPAPIDVDASRKAGKIVRKASV